MALTDSDTLNYRGALFMYGAQQAPFLNAISGASKRTRTRTFPIGNQVTLSAGAQTVQSEDTAAAAGTPTTVTLAQAVNVCQIQKHDVATTFAKESIVGQFSGLNVDGYPAALTGLAFQKKMQLMQMAKNLEYSFLQGTYLAESSSATACTTRGLKNGISSNTVAAGAKKLAKTMIEELVREMVANGSPFSSCVMLCNAFQMQMLSDIYGYAPMDRTVGGVAIQSFLVPGAGVIRTLFSPQMPTDEVYLVESSVCSPVFLPVPPTVEGIEIGAPQNIMENGIDVGYYALGTTAAQVGGFLYMQAGLDYGPEMWHGSITGLATSA